MLECFESWEDQMYLLLTGIKGKAFIYHNSDLILENHNYRIKQSGWYTENEVILSPEKLSKARQRGVGVETIAGSYPPVVVYQAQRLALLGYIVFVKRMGRKIYLCAVMESDLRNV